MLYNYYPDHVTPLASMCFSAIMETSASMVVVLKNLGGLALHFFYTRNEWMFENDYLVPNELW